MSGNDGPLDEGPVPHELIIGLWHHIVELDLEPDVLALMVPPDAAGELVEASLQLVAFLAFLMLHLNQPT